MHLLFVCTHNRCRSILAEAITWHAGGGLFTAASAGSNPVDAVHPLTLRYLHAHGTPTHGLFSKGWDEVREPQPDVVVMVCDRAAGEACPLWLGDAEKVHWGLRDPSALAGDEAETARAFDATIDVLERRIKALRDAIGPGSPAAEVAERMREIEVSIRQDV